MQPILMSPDEVPMPDKDVLVEIKDLHTYFHLSEGVVRAVEGADRGYAIEGTAPFGRTAVQ